MGTIVTLEMILATSTSCRFTPSTHAPQNIPVKQGGARRTRTKRPASPSCSGGELKGADNDEEALLTARVAAYRHSPEGRDRARMLKLMFKRRRLSVDEHDELDRLKAKYPEAPRETPLAKAIALRKAELRQRSN